MSQLDVLYRALVEYRKNTKDNHDCLTKRSAVITSNPDHDKILITRQDCKIHEDWIEAIERGIKFIENAINEQRQFIRSNGEVVPIEKVKRVSKDSVEHLARHSNLIINEQENEDDIVPANLYTVERLSDFAVYENRFLYMFLCFLRDFIGLRYEKIMEATNTYNGEMTMDKTVQDGARKVVYEVKLKEEKKNDEYLRTHNSAQTIIDRIQSIYKAIIFFLNTPLMTEVSKAPMLKPPVTRTNVLKMNKNFKQVLALYEYITAYEGDGFEIVPNVKTISPFTKVIADELAETVELSAFLTYEHGLGINQYFKIVYDKEETKRKEEEAKKQEEHLKAVRRQLKDGEIKPEEFIALLEKRVAELEKNGDELTAARNTIDELNTENERIGFLLNDSREKINSLESTIVTMQQQHEDEMEAEKTRHAQEVIDLKTAHAEEIDGINQAHAEQITNINNAHEEEITNLNTAHEEEKTALTENYENQIAGLNTEHEEEVQAIKTERDETVNSLNAKITETEENCRQEVEKVHNELSEKIAENKKIIAEAEARHAEMQKQCSALSDEKVLAEGRLLAIRAEHGLIKEDENFTNEAMIDELENQYLVFKKFFKTKWKVAKKEIRHDMFKQLKEDIRNKFKKKGTVTNAYIKQADDETASKTEQNGTPVTDAVNNASEGVDESGVAPDNKLNDTENK